MKTCVLCVCGFAVVVVWISCCWCFYRWSRTPLDEAVDFEHRGVASLLRERGGVEGEERLKKKGETRLKR